MTDAACSTAIDSTVRALRRTRSSRRARPTDRPVACWKEKDILDGAVADVFVVIFRTRGCSWALRSGCTMCGYINDCATKPVPATDMVAQLDAAMKQYDGEPFVKIFTSGSFFDDGEVAPALQDAILTRFGAHAHKVSVESRPEYIDDAHVEQATARCASFEVGIGLESANEFVSTVAINKGFSFDDFTAAAATLHRRSATVKTYLLLKPPFLLEHEAIADTIATARAAAPYSATLSINPVNIQNSTLVEYLWKRRAYRAPWFWSLAQVLADIRHAVPSDVHVMSHPSGAGSERGVHNCGACDDAFTKATAHFSLTQDASVFEKVHCDCHEQWRDVLDFEALSHLPADLYRQRRSFFMVE